MRFESHFVSVTFFDPWKVRLSAQIACKAAQFQIEVHSIFTININIPSLVMTRVTF
jgi:hypothetical protein